MDGGQGPLAQIIFATAANAAIFIALSFIPYFQEKTADELFSMGCLFMIPAAIWLVAPLVIIIGEHLAERENRPNSPGSSSK